MSTHGYPEAPYGPEPQERVPRPVMLQTWTDTTFLHWPYDPATIEPHLPGALEVDTFDGTAWVSLTPFLLRHLRPPGLPPVPWLSTSPETNVRTYVRGPDGKRGIWFFSLDIGRLPAVLFGRSVYSLPYMWTDVDVAQDGGLLRYRGRRRWPGERAEYQISVEPGPVFGDDELSELDHFLTARWVLYTSYGPVLAQSLAQHERWPLARASVVELREELVGAAGLPPPSAPPALVHLGTEVHVRISRPYIVSRRSGDPSGRMPRPVSHELGDGAHEAAVHRNKRVG